MAVGLALAGLATVASFAGYRQQKKAGELQSRARRLQNIQSELENDRRRRAFINESQAARASLVAEGVARGGAGGLESSTVQGAESSLFSQIGSELSFFSSQELLAERGVDIQNAAQDRLNRANLFSTVAQSAGLFAGVAG